MFRRKGLQAFYESGSKAGFNLNMPPGSRARLDAAKTPDDMNVPGWKLHLTHGTLQGDFDVWVSGNWGLVFAFENGDAILVGYVDYH